MIVLLAVAFAFLASGFALWVMYSIAPRVGLLDHPTERRKIHGNPVPLIGGIAIFYGLLLARMALEPPNPQQWLFGLLGCKVLVVIGVLDDHSGLGARVRLLAQTVAALLMTLGAGVTLHSLGDLLGFGPIELGPLAVPFTVFAVVGIINAFNMVDGIDGLAGGLVLIALVPCWCWSRPRPMRRPCC